MREFDIEYLSGGDSMGFTEEDARAAGICPEHGLPMAEHPNHKQTEAKHQDTVTPKSQTFNADEIIAEFRLRCAVLRQTIPRGWGATLAGSIRRQIERVHDLDAVILLEDESIVDSVRSFWDSQTFEWHFDFRTCTTSNHGAMLLYLTGDREHNIAMRIFASKIGLQLNEYGLWSAKEHKFIAGKTEHEIYRRLGLSYLVPRKRSFKLMRQSKLAEATP